MAVNATRLTMPRKPFAVTVLFLGEGKELRDVPGMGRSGCRLGGGGAALHPQTPELGPGFSSGSSDSTGLEGHTPYLRLPHRGENEAGSLWLENYTDLRLFPLLQIFPWRGA